MKYLALLALACVAADVPHLPTVFGLPLGGPIKLPACSAKQEDLCQEAAAKPAPAWVVSLRFSDLKRPWFLSDNTVQAMVVDGKLEGLTARTLPAASSQGIASELTEKFGPPTQNGSTGEGKEAELHMVWDRPAFTVEYIAPSANQVRGVFHVETASARALRLGAGTTKGAERTQL